VVANRGVPEKHIRAVYDKPPIDCDAMRAVRDFLASDKTSLVLAGGTGTRKSGSACWALTQRPGVFVTEDEVLRLFASRLPDDVEAWRRIRQAQVLLVDDIGEYSDDKGWGVKVITGLWNHRYSSELKLIVTANTTPAEFKSQWGERIVDRVRESGKFVELGGQSVRRAG
jgi:DNA replication protein DnaC